MLKETFMHSGISLDTSCRTLGIQFFTYDAQLFRRRNFILTRWLHTWIQFFTFDAQLFFGGGISFSLAGCRMGGSRIDATLSLYTNAWLFVLPFTFFWSMAGSRHNFLLVHPRQVQLCCALLTVVCLYCTIHVQYLRQLSQQRWMGYFDSAEVLNDYKIYFLRQDDNFTYSFISFEMFLLPRQRLYVSRMPWHSSSGFPPSLPDSWT